MAVKLCPYATEATNAGYEIIAAIPTGEVVNNLPSYIVTGRRGDEYVTWYAAFQVSGFSSEIITTSYFWGHYFSGNGAREKALADMIERAGITLTEEFSKNLVIHP